MSREHIAFLPIAEIRVGDAILDEDNAEFGVVTTVTLEPGESIDSQRVTGTFEGGNDFELTGDAYVDVIREVAR